MLEKIQHRLDEEIEKILYKEELSISDYFFLEGIVSRLKSEQSNKEMYQGTSDLLKTVFESLKTLKGEKECQCSKEVLT